MLTAYLTILTCLTSASTIVGSRITPSGNYTPTYGACPSSNTRFVRPASEGLNPDEAAWRQARNWNVKGALYTYLNNAQVPGLDVDAFIGKLHDAPEKVPVIGMSFSGGGNRAEMCELGLYQGLDGRYGPAVEAKTGGLLQAITYIAGLSGGALTVAGLAVNEFADLQTLISHGNLNLTANYDAFNELTGKAELGFPVTWGDVVGIYTMWHLALPLNQTINQDPMAWTWSGITESDAFKSGLIPMPILMDSEAVQEGPYSFNFTTPNLTVFAPAPTDHTIYEVTPFEFGSWTGRVKAFANTKYLGTPLQNGQPVNNTCVEGYDSAIYVGGTSLTALNLWYAQSVSNGTQGQFAKRFEPYPLPYPADEADREEIKVGLATVDLVDLSEGIAQQFNISYENFLYAYTVNPFVNYTDHVDPYTAQTPYLAIVDGSEGGQLNPVWPMIQPEREVDFLIVSDNGGTELSSGWMNGTSLGITYNAAKAENLPFPKIPSVKTMINLNHTAKPVFYGCYEDNVPLVLYLADMPYTAYTNITFSIDLNITQVRALTDNGLALISQDSNRLAEDWTSCLACASIRSSLKRVGMDEPDVCGKCWDRYCWNGQENETEPLNFLEPALILNPGLGYEEWNSTVFY